MTPEHFIGAVIALFVVCCLGAIGDKYYEYPWQDWRRW